ncbi:MAG: penicillin-binding protein 2 [Bacteroidota bacterium]
MKDNNQYRYRIIQLVFLLAAGVLVLKAMHLQLVDTTFQNRANTTAIGKFIKYPSRGLIYDRNGKLLINNNAMYDIMVTYNQVDWSMDTSRFCELLQIDRQTFIDNLDKDFRRDYRYSRSKPFVFLKKVPAETFARFQESLHEFKGFFAQLRIVRGYPYRFGAHVLGYMNEVNASQISKGKGIYSSGDYIGATGLEAAYEEQLRGKKGVEFVLKDNLGRVVGPYRNGQQDTAAVSGKDLITSLDIDLQAYGEELMINKTGSIVAIEPETGEILAMVSTPTYDPNLMTINRSRGETLQQLLNDTLQPFFDRTVMAQYPPGSIFKTVVALAAMQEGLSTPYTGITCNGGYFYNGRRYGCHAHQYPANVAIGIQHSCNTYFFNLVRRIIDKEGFYNPDPGLTTLDNYLYEFGLGRPLGIDYPNEEGGNVPDTSYYDNLYKNQWYSTAIMSIGIGQGEIQMTTLQMANLAATLANRGYYYPPHLVKAYNNESTPINEKYRTRKTVSVDAQYFPFVIDGMERAVKGGTATSAAIKDIAVCGKTGTSQNPHGDDHSVFFAFAPKDNPKIAIAVYVEHGVWGARYAAPIAGLMMEKYLKGNIDPSKQYLEDRMLQSSLIGQP